MSNTRLMQLNKQDHLSFLCSIYKIAEKLANEEKLVERAKIFEQLEETVKNKFYPNGAWSNHNASVECKDDKGISGIVLKYDVITSKFVPYKGVLIFTDNQVEITMQGKGSSSSKDWSVEHLIVKNGKIGKSSVPNAEDWISKKLFAQNKYMDALQLGMITDLVSLFYNDAEFTKAPVVAAPSQLNEKDRLVAENIEFCVTLFKKVREACLADQNKISQIKDKISKNITLAIAEKFPAKEFISVKSTVNFESDEIFKIEFEYDTGKYYSHRYEYLLKFGANNEVTLSCTEIDCTNDDGPETTSYQIQIKNSKLSYCENSTEAYFNDMMSFIVSLELKQLLSLNSNPSNALSHIETEEKKETPIATVPTLQIPSAPAVLQTPAPSIVTENKDTSLIPRKIERKDYIAFTALIYKLLSEADETTQNNILAEIKKHIQGYHYLPSEPEKQRRVIVTLPEVPVQNPFTIEHKVNATGGANFHCFFTFGINKVSIKQTYRYCNDKKQTITITLENRTLSVEHINPMLVNPDGKTNSATTELESFYSKYNMHTVEALANLFFSYTDRQLIESANSLASSVQQSATNVASDSTLITEQKKEQDIVLPITVVAPLPTNAQKVEVVLEAVQTKELERKTTDVLLPFQQNKQVSIEISQAPEPLVPVLNPDNFVQTTVQQEMLLPTQKTEEKDSTDKLPTHSTAGLIHERLSNLSPKSSSSSDPVIGEKKFADVVASAPPMELAPPPSYTAPSRHNRFDDSQPYNSSAIPSEFRGYHLTSRLSRKKFLSNNRVGDDYQECKEPGDIPFIKLPPEMSVHKDWLTRWRNKIVRVEVRYDEYGLITHNNKKEFLKPGIYYLPKATTTWHTNVKADKPLIEHGDIKIITVPEGHYNHLGPLNSQLKRDWESKYGQPFYLLAPGRHVLDAGDVKNSKVLDPYGLEVTLEGGDKVLFARVPNSKKGFGLKSPEAGSSVCEYPVGLTYVDPDSEFKGRVSTKVRTVTLKDVKINLKGNKQVTVDVMVNCVIPDDAHLLSKYDNLPGALNMSSVCKVVQNYGYDEDQINQAIEGPNGLAEQVVKNLCSKEDISTFIKHNQRVINAPDINLNTQQNWHSYKGVKFLSVVFTKINLSESDDQQQVQKVIEEIENLSKRELQLLEPNGISYLDIRNQVVESFLADSKNQIKQLEAELSDVPLNENKTVSPLPSMTPVGLYNQRQWRQEQQRREIKASSQRYREYKNFHLFQPGQSKDYFKSVDRDIGSKYQNYNPETAIPCLNEKYINSLRGNGYIEKFLRFLPKFLTGRKIEQGEIGLIRVNGRPEFLAPGSYSFLPPSIEWVGTRKISDKLIKHDSITIANIKTDRDIMYAENNTLVDDSGNLQSYGLLDVGVHVIDSPTTCYKDREDCKQAFIVKKSEDECSRIKKPRKNVKLPEQDPSNKVLSVNVAFNEAVNFYDENGELGVLGPGQSDIEAKWMIYSRDSTDLNTKTMTVEAYTADGVLVTVPVTVKYQIPVENNQLYTANLEFGVNKKMAAVEMLIVEKVIEKIQSWNYITETRNFIDTNSDEFVGSLNKGMNEKGINIVDIEFNSEMVPVSQSIRIANEKRLKDKADKEEGIRKAVKSDPVLQKQLLDNQARIRQLEIEKRNKQSSAGSQNSSMARMVANQRYGSPCAASSSSSNASALTAPPPAYQQ